MKQAKRFHQNIQNQSNQATALMRYDIDITREHSVGLDKTRDRVEQFSQKLKEDFAISYHWNHNTVHFHRSMVKGCIDIEPSSVRIRVKLGLVFKPMKREIHEKISRYMDEIIADT